MRPEDRKDSSGVGRGASAGRGCRVSLDRPGRAQGTSVEQSCHVNAHGAAAGRPTITIYRPRIEQSQCVRRESRSFLNKVFEGDAGEMLLHFIEHEDISPEQIKQLKTLLHAKQLKQEKEPR
jgi:Penicillinase repressor